MEYQAYEEGEHLGTGAQGKAVLIRGPQGQLAVSKQITVDHLPEDAGKVHHEVKVLAALKHPHIVGYLGSFERPGLLCIIMEYADGGSLAEVLKAQAKREAAFASEQVVRWLLQLGSALEHVHSHRVLHRDIKPEVCAAPPYYRPHRASPRQRTRARDARHTPRTRCH